MQNSSELKSGLNTAPVQFSDADDLLDIRYDHIFKAVFTKETSASKGALGGLISALIDRKVSVDVIKVNEPPVGDTRERNIRFDISCRAQNGEQINIEMCFYPNPGEHERIEYFTAKLFTGQGIRGIDKKYTDLKETYQISILGESNLFKDNVLLHTFQYYDPVSNTSLLTRLAHLPSLSRYPYARSLHQRL